MIRRPSKSSLFLNPMFFFFLMIRRPPRSPPFPYTTLFRSFPGSSPASLPSGWSVLDVRLEGVAGDSEPRDDARLFVLEVSPQPSVVLLASPPDWETRFLARDRKSTRLNSSHGYISYAVFCL